MRRRDERLRRPFEGSHHVRLRRLADEVHRWCRIDMLRGPEPRNERRNRMIWQIEQID